MLENVYLPVLPSLLSTCFVSLSNVLGTRDIDEWEQAEGRARLRTHSAVHHARLCALRWPVPGVIPPMLKPQSVLRKLERGSPHCWLRFSEWNEFKTENNDLNPRGPIRCSSL